jgi:hypothetical protein
MAQPDVEACRLATTIDPRLADVWATLFGSQLVDAELGAEALVEQVGWFLRMAYLRGYSDGLGPEAGSLYRELRHEDAPPSATAGSVLSREGS